MGPKDLRLSWMLKSSISTGTLAYMRFLCSIFYYRLCCFSLFWAVEISLILVFACSIFCSISVYFSGVKPGSFNCLRPFWISLLHFSITSFLFYSICYLSSSSFLYFSICSYLVVLVPLGARPFAPIFPCGPLYRLPWFALKLGWVPYPVEFGYIVLKKGSSMTTPF